MHILFFSHYFPPEVNAPASRTYENCKRWVNQGHTVTVITCVPNCPNGVVYDGYRNRLFQKENIDGIEVIRVWTYIAANEGTVKRIINYLSYMISATLAAVFRKKSDIVIATSPQFFCGWAGVLTSKIKRIPFILEIRDIWPESIVAVGAMRNSIFIRILEKLEKIMYASACHIVTVGEGYRDVLLKKGVRNDKISIITNGVDCDLFKPVAQNINLKKKFGINGEFVCSYCGTIGMASGLDIVLRAAEELKEKGDKSTVFLLVGDGANRKALEAERESKSLHNVIFTGRVEKHMVPDILSLSDACLIHLRKADLFTTVIPSKFFEAAGMGRPIINGVAGQAARFVEKANAGINIEPESAEDLLEALTILKNDHNLSRSFSKSGEDYVKKHFNRDVLAERYMQVIIRVADFR